MVDRDVRKVGLTVRLRINRLRINGVRTGITRLRVLWADQVVIICAHIATNWNPAIRSSSRIAIVDLDEGLSSEPINVSDRKWDRFWVDELGISKISNSFCEA